MSSLGSPSPFFLAGKKGYEVKRSLRFNSADSTYLINSTTRTVATAAYTISLWVKLGTLSSSIVWIAGGMNSSGANNSFGAIYYYQNKFYWYHYSGNDSDAAYTDGVIRDPSAWYHVLISKPVGSNGTLYLNGVAQTKQTANSNESDIFSGNLTIGVSYTAANGYYRYFDGYIAEVNAIDGTALTPSSFTETNSLTGQLVPKKYTGSYGSRGFYLNFSDNSGTTATTLGRDYSGNSENFTPNNFSVTLGTSGNDSVEDTPTNNFPVLNPLNINPYSLSNYPSGTFSNGNLTFTTNTTSQVNYAESSVYFPTTGKWYLEVIINNLNIGSGVGYLQALTIRSSTSGNRYLWWVYSSPYYQINTDSGLVTISGPSNADTLQLAFDADTGKTWFGRNNTWYLSGDPANGTAMSSPIVIAGDDVRFSISGRSGSATNKVSVNFGQQGFTYTPPTGFKALNSTNLPDPTIAFPNKHFDTLLWDGNSTKDTDISGLNFSPDWVWIKSRSHSVYAGSLKYNHVVWDTLRGVGLDTAASTSRKELTINETYAEGNATNLSNYYGHVSAFNSDGFELDHITGQPPLLTNMSGRTYVGWSWNAGDTDGKTYAVTVVSDSGNKYRFDGYGTSAVTLDLAEGGTYIFDQSDASNATHPLRFYTAADKTGGEYTTGVTTAGTPGQAGAYTQIVVAASAPTLYYQCSAHANMGGQANTNSTLGSSNFDGSIQSTVKVNASAGFSIVTYTGNGSDGATIGHGLGVKPDFIIIKKRVNNTGINNGNWILQHKSLTNGVNATSSLFTLTSYSNSAIYFNLTNGESSYGFDNQINGNTDTFVAYCFSSVAGYSKFGSYTGNGSANGPFVFTGFRPAWIMIKLSGYTGNWIIFDNKRDPYNYSDTRLFANLSNADTGSYNVISMLSNGFKFENQYDGSWNRNATKFIYLAFAESPFKNARAR